MGVVLGKEVERPEVGGWLCLFLAGGKRLEQILRGLLDYHPFLFVGVETFEIAEEGRDPFGETLEEVFADGLFEIH